MLDDVKTNENVKFIFVVKNFEIGFKILTSNNIKKDCPFLMITFDEKKYCWPKCIGKGISYITINDKEKLVNAQVDGSGKIWLDEKLVEAFGWLDYPSDRELVGKEPNWNEMCLQNSNEISAFIETVVMLGHHEKMGAFFCAYENETKIYQLLIDKNIDCCFHYHIFRRILDKYGFEYLVNLNLEDDSFKIKLNESIKFIEKITGIPLKSRLSIKRTKRDMFFYSPIKKQITLEENEEKTEDEPEHINIISAVQQLCDVINKSSNLCENGPGCFRLGLNKNINFKLLSGYCVGTETSVESSILPDRVSWDGVPFFLNDDGMKYKKVYSYVVTDRKSLSDETSRAYSEIFLPGQSFTVLNFDLDLRTKNNIEHERYKEKIENGTIPKRFIFFVIQTSCEFLKNEISLKIISDIKKLPSDCWGELAVYMREEARDKISCRFIWYPPLELCFTSIEELKKWLIILKEKTAEDQFFGNGSLDTAPFSTHKSCRLPCASKMSPEDGSFNGVFTFKKLYNSFMKTEIDRNTMAAGLSRQPVSINSRHFLNKFLLVKRLETWHAHLQADNGYKKINTETEVSDATKQTIGDLMTPIQKMWPCELRITEDPPFIRVAPVECRNQICPIHQRSHTNATFTISIINKRVYPHCFSSNTPKHLQVIDSKKQFLELFFNQETQPVVVLKNKK